MVGWRGSCLPGAVGCSRRIDPGARLAVAVRDTRGASLVEYLVVVGLVALFALAGWRSFGQRIDDKAAAQAACVTSLSCGSAGNAATIASAGESAPVDGASGAAPTAERSSGISAVAGNVWSFGKGFVLQGWDTVVGIYDIVRDPVGAAQGIGHAIAHPVQTYEALRDSLAEAWQRDPADVMGRGVFEVATIFVAPLKLAKAAKLRVATRTAEVVEHAAETAAAADKAADAARIVEAVDDAAAAERLAARAVIEEARQQGRVVLNLGGEGEVPGAINVNNMEGLRRGPAALEGKPVLRADMTHMPIEPGSVDEVIGNKVPSQFDFPDKVAAEAHRVLQSGGTIRINSVTGGAQRWVQVLEDAGFTNVRVEGGYAVGTRP
jgi:pilus assembly protein Flp/PilA